MFSVKIKKKIIQIKFYLWLSYKLLVNKKSMFGGSGPLSMLGLSLGVAALMASQSVMSGFESTLKKAVIDVTSDIQVIKRGRLIDSWPDFKNEVMNSSPAIQKMLGFVSTEAVVASQGKVSGALVQGLDIVNLDGVLNFSQRIKSGNLPRNRNEIAIGTGLALKLNLKIDDKIYIAVPLSTPFDSSSLQRSAEEFLISGVLDMGKNDWNERLVIAHIKDIQRLTQIQDRYTGAFIKTNDTDHVVQVSNKMSAHLEPKYYLNNWYNLNRNLLEAAKLEKVVIFFVVFLIVLIAAFNISSTLYVLIKSRYKDIAVLKTLGFESKSIKYLFIMQGFVIGTIGSFIGFIIGFILCYGFMWLQYNAPVISGSIYKIDRIDVQINFFDIGLIYLTTLMACVLASYFPARKASQLTIIECMKQE